MDDRTFNLSLFICRAQPLHLGHCYVISQALEYADKVCILLGSSFTPRSYRNPWLFEERKEMILNTFKHVQDRIVVLPLEDCAYNDAQWILNVQHSVSEVIEAQHTSRYPRITLIGHNKDNSSYYLKLFPQWASINVPAYTSEELIINSTDIRDHFFKRDNDLFLLNSEHFLPEAVVEFLRNFSKTSTFNDIVDEYEFIQSYKKSWETAPYTPIFVTGDAVVIQSGHVLLVKRKARPGKGLWALPGGFIRPDEKIEDGIIRELREETKIKVPIPVLKGSIVSTRVFDNPFRSSRGRTITHAALFNLAPATSLAHVKGSDDAEKAQWVPLADVKREHLFEDHKDIIDSMSAIL